MLTGRFQTLFLQQSCLDSWSDYERSLRKENFLKWDMVILTASNEAQAEIYRHEIENRRAARQLPDGVHYAVLPDPEGKRVGSGGATFHVLRYIAEQNPEEKDHFAGKRILVIHSGGDSKRVPQYSVCGKLFSPVPRELPDGRPSTLFDEFMICMSGVPSRMKEGMVVLSGDVLLLFNPLQLDFQYRGAAAISIKAPAETGKDHGVFLSGSGDLVERFLHKQSVETLQSLGAVNESGRVDLDTGAIALDAELLNALYGLISTENCIDPAKYGEFVNERARVSFYGDFLYPLAQASTLEAFYEEAPEGERTPELQNCRKKIWEALSGFSLKLICLSPAEFIHFGTTGELLSLVTEQIGDYEFLGWKKQVVSNAPEDAVYAAHKAYVGRRAEIGPGAYLENSFILGETAVGEGAVVSNLRLDGQRIRPHTVAHGLRLLDGRHVARIYGTHDNPKGTLEGNASFLNTTLSRFLEQNGLSPADLWEDETAHTLWEAKLYPACGEMQEALNFGEILYRMAEGAANAEEIRRWKAAERLSLCGSFNCADGIYGGDWQCALQNRILASKFTASLEKGAYYRDALKVFGTAGLTPAIREILEKDAEEADTPLQVRIDYAISRWQKEHQLPYDRAESRCFGAIQQAVYRHAIFKISGGKQRISRDEVIVELPVRVNWGGGWTDTPPYCMEQGGVVLNAAIRLGGILPIRATVRRLEEPCIQLESTDIGAFETVRDAAVIQQYNDPFDPFALHKAALISCGVIPLEGKVDLQALLSEMGGGIYLATQVVGVPKGSGLGTSSILSAACVKALSQFFGGHAADAEISDTVLCMEQIMSTGGGWQDQIGGLMPGIKFMRTEPGIDQKVRVEQVQMPDPARKELEERFALIYTGQRRLARNLLRDVVGGYIGARPESLEALREMKPVAALMRFALEQGDIDEFARLLNRHWDISKKLDGGSTNTCIDQIFMVCEDLIDGRFIAGAGGGGFLQVILKKGVSREELSERLHHVFQDSGVRVWDSEFLF